MAPRYWSDIEYRISWKGPILIILYFLPIFDHYSTIYRLSRRKLLPITWANRTILLAELLTIFDWSSTNLRPNFLTNFTSLHWINWHRRKIVIYKISTWTPLPVSNAPPGLLMVCPRKYYPMHGRDSVIQICEGINKQGWYMGIIICFLGPNNCMDFY